MERGEEVRRILLDGTVIPAHPLALDCNKQLDTRRQRLLTKYYLDSGVGGLAVGVHTTQFAIHDNGMLKPVLELAHREAAGYESAQGRTVVMIAGICGRTEQALREAEMARELGYDTGLLSLAGMRDADNAELLSHCREVAEILPLFGFYLQPAVGGRVLGYEFWREFFEIPNVLAVKVAPFNRYQTLDVVRALAESGRQHEIALYTGNDDHIVLDLLTRYRFSDHPDAPEIGFSGGLLGHWAFWTRSAVLLFERVKAIRRNEQAVPRDLLIEAQKITDVNAVVFDVAHNFHGCIPGIHEMLRRVGLLEGIWCLDPDETLSPGQEREIDRIWHAYPELRDDDFVRENLDRWLANL